MARSVAAAKCAGCAPIPDLLPNEVEIARVVLKSTTMDVKSIRARRTKRRIVYRIWARWLVALVAYSPAHCAAYLCATYRCICVTLQP